MTSEEVPLPALARQTLLTPGAAGIPFTDFTMDDNDKQLTGSFRRMEWGFVLRDNPTSKVLHASGVFAVGHGTMSGTHRPLESSGLFHSFSI